ncbi:MAG: hypothetical protein IKU00_09020 [Bacteroidales bacterium]|nr:hypothetical protein [Bacteroidales bacterium]
MEWSSKGGLKKNPKEVVKSNVPAIAKGKPEIDFDQYIFIDCSSENCSRVVFELADVVGYLSLAISEVKDRLFRLHKDGCSGNVNFVIAAYQPMQLLMFAMLALLGIPVNDCMKYKDFIRLLSTNCWFSSLRCWLEKYHWKPVLKEGIVYQGYFYGVSQESDYSRATKKLKKFYLELQKTEPYFKGGGMRLCKDAWIEEYKEAGGASTDMYAKGEDKPIYHKGEGQGTFESFFLDEEPLGYVDGKYYTVGEMRAEVKKWEKIQQSDPVAPKTWYIDKPPKNGKRGVDMAAVIDADTTDMEKEFLEWEATTYRPQMAEYNQYIRSIDKRETDSKESSIWERKKTEDEAISKKWSADKDEILYHGKVRKRAEFENEKEKLNKQRNEWLTAIAERRDIATRIRILKAISAVQFGLGFISLGVAAPVGAAILLGIDALLEGAKIAVDFTYDKNYTWGKAVDEHLGGIICDGVSALLLIPQIARFTSKELKAINSMAPSPSTPAPKTSQYVVKTSNPKFNYTTQTTGTDIVSSHGSVSTGTAKPVQKPIQYTENGKNYEIVSITGDKKNKNILTNNFSELKIGDNLNRDTGYFYVKIRPEGGGKAITRKWNAGEVKNNTGKTPKEWKETKDITAQHSGMPTEMTTQYSGMPEEMTSISTDRIQTLKQEVQTSFPPGEDKHLAQIQENGNVSQSPKDYLQEMINYVDGEKKPLKFKFVTKQAKDAAFWLANVEEGIKAVKGGKIAKGSLHFLGGSAKAATFIYSGFGMYQNCVFVVSTQDLSLEMAKRLGVDEIDGKNVEDVFNK